MASARTLRILHGLAVVGAMLALTPATEASQVLPVNLEEMTRHAASIFSGRVIETHTTVDPALGRKLTITVFEVEQSVKGQLGATFTLRTLDGVSDFHLDDEVVLFLYGESKLGLSSPVGLGQGRFSIVRDKGGRRVAINDLGNDRLLSGLTPQAQSRLGASISPSRSPADIEAPELLGMAAALLAGDAR